MTTRPFRPMSWPSVAQLFPRPLDANGDYPGEVGWNFSGGGGSQFELQPHSINARTTPDVVFDAAGGVAVYDSYDYGAGTPWISEAGTSFSVLGWDALIATADQGTSSQNLGTLNGSAVATTLYNIASAPGSIGFNAITAGNKVTGLGTPQVPALVAGLSGEIGVPTPLSPTGQQTTTVPTFRWPSVSGALSYHLLVVDLNTNATVLNVNVTGTTEYTPTGPTFLPGDTYQWQVQAYPVLAGQGNLMLQSVSPLNRPIRRI